MKIAKPSTATRAGPFGGESSVGSGRRLCGRIEAELAELPRSECRQRQYLASYGLKESALHRLITATYSLLGLMSFLTAGANGSARAVDGFRMNFPAGQGGGRQSTRTFEKKFIRAENGELEAACGMRPGYPGARDKGKSLRTGRPKSTSSRTATFW